jgi:hypothetical protein
MIQMMRCAQWVTNGRQSRLLAVVHNYLVPLVSEPSITVSQLILLMPQPPILYVHVFSLDAVNLFDVK